MLLCKPFNWASMCQWLRAKGHLSAGLSQDYWLKNPVQIIVCPTLSYLAKLGLDRIEKTYFYTNVSQVDHKWADQMNIVHF